MEKTNTKTVVKDKENKLRFTTTGKKFKSLKEFGEYYIKTNAR